MSLDQNRLYFDLRSEMSRNSDRGWTLRSWAVAVAGAAFTAIIGAVGYGNLGNGYIDDPAEFAAIVFMAASVINAGLWYLISQNSQGNMRIAAYLFWLEQELDFKQGWEHWVFYRSLTRKGRPILDLRTILPFLCGLSYVCLILFLAIFNSNARLMAYFAMSSVFFIGAIRSHRRIAPSRRAALVDLMENKSKNWASEIDSILCRPEKS